MAVSRSELAQAEDRTKWTQEQYSSADRRFMGACCTFPLVRKEDIDVLAAAVVAAMDAHSDACRHWGELLKRRRIEGGPHGWQARRAKVAAMKESGRTA